MPTLVSVTNYPTPYRIHFFNVLAKSLEQQNWDYKVEFMSMSEPGRFWTFDQDKWQFKFQIDSKLPMVMWGQSIHLNPGIIYRLISSPPEIVLLSGAWFHPTIQILLSLLKLCPNTRIYFWSESNQYSIKHANGLIKHWRVHTYSKYDGFLVPGEWAEQYVLQVSNKVFKQSIIRLPNIIDNNTHCKDIQSYRNSKCRLRHRLQVPKQRILLLVARLHFSKGIIPFLESFKRIHEDLSEEIYLLIAGDGDLKGEIKNFLQNHCIKNVQLLGHLDEATLRQYYALADAFVLPSLSDPYPLAVIEAIFAGLPLLLSSHVGCHPEILHHGHNGWLFTPNIPSSIEKALYNFSQTSEEALTAMKLASSEIAQKYFRTETVIDHLLQELEIIE